MAAPLIINEPLAPKKPAGQARHSALEVVKSRLTLDIDQLDQGAAAHYGPFCDMSELLACRRGG